MVSNLTPNQLRSLETVERVASCFSLVGTVFIFVTFVSSSTFRKPINRLIFAASWGNTVCNIATLLSQSGIRAGQGSHLCQFQGFLIQMFIPADAFWNLAMAINVYMTLFRNYKAEQLKALEWKYHIFCYGVPFVIALACIFIDNSSRGRVYGPAVLWCWISTEWAFLRVALLYGPAWICILAAFTIYVIAGREIFKKRQQLRSFNNLDDDHNFSAYKTTDVQVTSELASIARENAPYFNSPQDEGISHSEISAKSYEPYTVNIAASIPMSPRHPMNPRSDRPSALHSASVNSVHVRNRIAIEANTAAWGYTKVALLFFISLLVTWVPSSINRVYSLIHPSSTSIALTYSAGTVLSLMGFWNSMIYITTSRAACKSIFIDIWSYLRHRDRAPVGERLEDRSTLGSRRIKVSESAGDSKEQLASGEHAV